MYRDIFDGELLMNLSVCRRKKKNAVWDFFLLFLSYIFILSRPIELIYSIYYLSKSAVAAELVTVAFLIIFADLTKR